MEKYQIDQLDMLYGVQNHFNENTDAWSSNEPLSDAKAELDAKIASIGAQYAIQLVNTTGVALDKSSARFLLEEAAFTLGSAMAGYANVINNNTLYNSAYHPRSFFTLLRGSELIGEAVILQNLANDILLPLAPYGIDTAFMSNYQNLLNGFTGNNLDPQNAIDLRKNATERIATLLPEAIDFLNKRMDNLIVSLKATKPEFVGVYYNARNIVNTGAQVRSLTTLCLDSVTNAPVELVDLVIVGQNIKRTSPASGYNIFQNLPEGVNRITASRVNYASQTVEFSVVNGLTTELAISLVSL